MICSTCKAESSRVVVNARGVELCHSCVGFSEAGGTSTTGALTRHAFRIRSQRDMHEGDMVLPHSYDKARRAVGINPDFVKLYPEQAGEYFGDRDMVRAGYSKLPEHVERHKAAVAADVASEAVSFEGSATAGMEKILA